MELRVMAFTMLAAVSPNGSVWIDLAQFDTLNNSALLTCRIIDAMQAGTHVCTCILHVCTVYMYMYVYVTCKVMSPVPIIQGRYMNI